ncbi:MAG: TlpA disulfide reductase family protein [Saprospiraceae bacterium]
MFPYRLRLLLIFLSFLLACTGSFAQSFTVYDSLPQLEERVRQNDGHTTLVINFWATWCKPCVEELPSFDELSERYADKNVQVLLVSLDFKSKLHSGFIPFLLAHQLQSEVILFADQDANTWIPRVHEAWDGAIPATIVLRGSTKMFHTGKFESYDDLETFVQPFLGVIDAPTPELISSKN